MFIPNFTFDAEANGYISTPFTVARKAQVIIELASRAPVVTLKQENDGSYANYGQTPKQATGFRINLRTKKEMTIKLATPVQVTKCYIHTQ